MLQTQTIAVSTLAASNQQVSTTRINTPKYALKSRQGNTGKTRVGFATFNDVTREWTAPTSPLTDSTANTIVLEPGESWTPPVTDLESGRGETYNLQRIYAQGTDSNVLEVIYVVEVTA